MLRHDRVKRPLPTLSLASWAASAGVAAMSSITRATSGLPGAQPT